MRLLFKHEALSTERPAGEGVEYGDDDRHVRSTNGHGQGDAHHAGQGGGGAEHGQAGAHARVVQEVSHGSHVGGQQTGVESVSAGQHEGVGAQVTVQLSVGDQGSSEGDSTNVCTKEGGGLDHGGSRVGGKAGEMVNVCGNTGEDSGHTNQGVEGGDQLGKVGDLDLLGDGCSDGSSAQGSSHHLGEHLGVGLEKSKCGGDTGADSDDSKSVTEPGGGLGGQTSQGSDTAEAGGEVGHLVNLGESLRHSVAIGSQECGGGNTHQHWVLWGVGGSLEHVQHPLGDDEASKDVDEGDEGSRGGQSLNHIGGIVAAAHEKETADSGDAGDGVSDGHQRRVEGGDDAPDGVVADNTAQGEGGGHVGEGGTGRRCSPM